MLKIADLNGRKSHRENLTRLTRSTEETTEN